MGDHLAESTIAQLLGQGLEDLDAAFGASLQRRKEAIDEAAHWPGSERNTCVTTYSHLPNGYRIRFRKPGKDALKYPYDMTPQLWKGRGDTGLLPTFGELYGWLEDLRRDPRGIEALDIVATLLLRDAYMLDHTSTQDGWRYCPPAPVVSQLESLAPTIGPMATLNVLHLVDAVALNEDVRYSTGGGPTERGRYNNLLTAVRMITVMLDRERLSSAVGRLVQGGFGGVSPLEATEARRRLPLAHGAESDGAVAHLKAEQDIEWVLSQARGLTPTEIDERAGTVNRNHKDTGWRNGVIMEALERECAPASIEYLKQHAVLRVVRLNHRLRPKENVLLCGLDMNSIGNQTWETSPAARTIMKRHIFVVLAEDRLGDERVARIRFHSFGKQNIASVRKVWIRSQKAVIAGRLDRLPKASTKDTRVCLINTQDPKKGLRSGPGGTKVTARSLYLNPTFLRELLDRP